MPNPAASPSSSPVSSTRCGEILVITLDNPPVNALGAEVRRGLASAIDAAQADAEVAAVLMLGAGRNFSAGADIREFGQARQPPELPEVCDRIEASGKPVIAAIHGAALGGGLELALAAHYRLAIPETRLGFPEVSLGLLPGAGGTQRTPRLIGVAAALDLMLSGRPIDARPALTLGLIDRLGESADSLAEGLAYARELLARGTGPRPTRDERNALGRTDLQQAALAAVRAELETRRGGLFSRAKIIDAVAAALERPFEEGLRMERDLFMQCMNDPQRAALVYAFLAERQVAKTPAAQTAVARTIKSVGVVGGGTMGAGIAVTILDAGLPVTMVEHDEASLARGQARVEAVYDALIAKGRMSPQAKAAVMGRFSGSVSYSALAPVDFVIEAVFEDMEVKKAVFAGIDRVCKKGAVLASNTSYLDVDEIATSVSRPADVIGLHFFSPANIMKLVEIVVPRMAAPEVVATSFELAKRLKKLAVRSGVCDGFIGNRILSVCRTAADYMVEDGASPYQIDRALREFGYPMGPFQVSDLAGGDIGWATRKRRALTRDPRLRYVHIADRLCERGWFGQKTGRGWYLYPGGARTGQEDPTVLALVEEERAKAGIKPRTFSDQEIVRRHLASMINEGANVVAEGIALRPLDVDVVVLSGYGFPRHRGGPMWHADTQGLARVLSDIRQFGSEDALFWKPSPLLVELVDRDADFASLNER
jgi:3-hydroxyacyl-CoA dehydrogenase